MTTGKFLKWLVGGAEKDQPKPTHRELIQRESVIGGRLFGAIPKGHHRQFFNLDRNTWILYEERPDENGEPQSLTTRYEIRENGILKVQENSRRYYYIEGIELANLVTAIRLYYEQVSRQVYARDPATGKLLTV